MRTIDADAFKKYIDAQEGRPFIGCTVGEAMKILIDEQPTIQPEKAQLPQQGTTFDMISKFIDGLEEIFADLRERHVDDSVCGLCEYDGAYMGQSGDWCNECPGFDMDDCFKLSDKTRKKWTEEIIKALPTVQPEPQEGRFERKRDGVFCSVCHYGWEFITGVPAEVEREYHYCPNCGARMKGE